MEVAKTDQAREREELRIGAGGADAAEGAGGVGKAGSWMVRKLNL
jgi:hypothetical protein